MPLSSRAAGSSWHVRRTVHGRSSSSMRPCYDDAMRRGHVTSSRMTRVVAFVLTAFAAATVTGACAKEAPLQGDPFVPDGALPVDPVSDRLDASRGCNDGATCDSGDAGLTLPAVDGGGDPKNTCQTARSFGTLSGDTGAQTITTNGTCSEWLTLRATEDDSGPIGATMKVTLTLKPVGHDFDLYAYLSPTRDELSCAMPYAVSPAGGTVDEVITLSFGESTVANGSDEGRTIGVVVLSARGPCPPSSGWTLTANGNR